MVTETVAEPVVPIPPSSKDAAKKPELDDQGLPMDWLIETKVLEPGYEKLAEVFKKNFEDLEEIGAGLCAYVNGEDPSYFKNKTSLQPPLSQHSPHILGKCVLDMEGGFATPDFSRPYAGSLQASFLEAGM